MCQSLEGVEVPESFLAEPDPFAVLPESDDELLPDPEDESLPDEDDESPLEPDAESADAFFLYSSERESVM